MMSIVLVNVPAIRGKKPYDLAFPFWKQFNFGLLALASYLSQQNEEVVVYDPQVYERSKRIALLLDLVQRVQPKIVGLSCISGFSYVLCREMAVRLRERFPDIPIVVGGKDHVGNIPQKVLLELPVDIVVRGEGEVTLHRVVRALREQKDLSGIPNISYLNSKGDVYSTQFNLEQAFTDEIPMLDYMLYPEFRLFAPSIEVGRGCPFNCAFCPSARSKVRKKSVSTIIEEASTLSELYKNSDLKIYFEALTFAMSEDELLRLREQRNQRGLGFTWRTETRVEYLTPKRLSLMAKAGCRVIDVGLESADPDVLARMRKTSDSSRYLSMASTALREAWRNGIILKMNVLFYVGETKRSLISTYSFLMEHRSYVKSISAYPLLMYPGAPLHEGDIRSKGGSIRKASPWQELHVWPVDSSRSLSYEKLQEIGLLFAQSFQTMQTFFTQKQYGYFSPGTTFEEFVARAERYGLVSLPFSRDEKEARSKQNLLWRILTGLEE